jgi:hypothetical protein
LIPIASTCGPATLAAVEDSWRAFRTSGWAQQPPRERMRVMRRWAYGANLRFKTALLEF